MQEPTPTEQDCLRQLAGEVADLAAAPAQADKRRRWTLHNQLAGDQPLILVLPGETWSTLLPPLVLERQPFRGWERQLRQAIHRARYLADDAPINPVLDVDWRFTISHWSTPQLHQRQDPHDLQAPRIEVDETGSVEELTLAGAIMGDILRVRRRSTLPPVAYGPIARARQLRGLDHLLLDLYEDPDWVEALLQVLTRHHLDFLDQLEAGGWLTLNNEADRIHTGGLGYSEELPAAQTTPDVVSCRELWGGLEAEAIAGTSRNLFERVFLPSIVPVIERFGLGCFGGREPIEEWIQGLRQISNLRRLSVSHLADIEGCARQIKKRYVVSYKPSAAPLCTPRVDWPGTFQELLAPLAQLREYNCHVELVMSDMTDLHGDADRLPRWVDTARQVIDVVYG